MRMSLKSLSTNACRYKYCEMYCTWHFSLLTSLLARLTTRVTADSKQRLHSRASTKVQIRTCGLERIFAASTVSARPATMVNRTHQRTSDDPRCDSNRPKPTILNTASAKRVAFIVKYLALLELLNFMKLTAKKSQKARSGS
jgi:hypothetical protein